MGQAACLLGSGGSDTSKSRHDTRRATEVAIAIKFLNRWLMRRGIEPHIPVLDREHQTKGYFTRADFYLRRDDERIQLSGREDAPEQRPRARRRNHALAARRTDVTA